MFSWNRHSDLTPRSSTFLAKRVAWTRLPHTVGRGSRPILPGCPLAIPAGDQALEAFAVISSFRPWYESKSCRCIWSDMSSDRE